MPNWELYKQTKYVNLTFFMKAGVRITGQFHIPKNTSASIRPSDALQQANGFINLAKANIASTGGLVRDVPFVAISLDAIAWVEFPPVDHSWIVDGLESYNRH